MLIDRDNNSENFIELYAKFNKIDGVNVGTSVVISGIKVGEVNRIFLKDNYPNIAMNIDQNVEISNDSSNLHPCSRSSLLKRTAWIGI